MFLKLRLEVQSVTASARIRKIVGRFEPLLAGSILLVENAGGV
jgi:hypothetical protein